MEFKQTSDRDPYPFPTLQNDNDFMGIQQQWMTPYNKPTHLAQTEDPWNRLYATCTLASSRREVCHNDPRAPRDSLDFVLTSQYNHHDKFLKNCNETLFQPETLGLEHGRILKNRVKEEVKPKPYLNHPLQIFEEKKKESIHSIENAIEGHHTQTTNRGYSRKPDGGFFV